jgi:Fe-Mn family superoxide dismutase
MKLAAGASTALAIASAGNGLVFAKDAAAGKKQIVMVPLPYPENALEPSISARTVHEHYNKHHKSFFTTLKNYVSAHSEYQNLTLEELILKNKGGILLDDTIFYVSVLLYNHNWYWQSLAPKAGGEPKGELKKLVVTSYGSYDGFRKAFSSQASKLGAGWVWVVLDADKLKVYRTSYHETPLTKGWKPLLAVDVWEHAYYLDYQSDRQKYIDAVLDNLLNWKYAEKQLAKKKK